MPVPTSTQWDPRTKFAVTLAILVLISVAKTPMACMITFFTMIACMRISRIPLLTAIMRLLPPMAIAFLLWCMHSLMIGHTPLASMGPGWLHISVFREGFDQGRLVASKILAGSSLVLLYHFTTSPHVLFATLRTLGVSDAWLDVAQFMQRYLAIFANVVQDVWAAQTLRLGHRSSRTTLHSIGLTTGVTIIRAFNHAVAIEQAMKLRSGKGIMPYAPMSPWSLPSKTMTIVMILMASGTGYLIERMAG